jgi:NADH dehydrogenase
VIVGAGFGGLLCARALDGELVDVTLVDRNNYHLFTPLLYQVASSLLNPSDIAYPVRSVFRGSRNVRFLRAEVTRVDLDARRVELATGEPLAYDWLVVASGSTTNFFGREDVARHAFGLKTLEEALALRNHILACLEEASRAADLGAQEALLTFVVVGGGPTGVEYAGALAELMRLVVPREYPVAVRPRIVLAEGRDRLLGPFSEPLGRYTEKRLERMGVSVRTGVTVDAVDAATVLLSSGERLAARTLVWAAGVKPGELGAALPTRPTGLRRVEVDPWLRIGGRADAFAVGDLAAAMDHGKELPMISPPAMQQGRYVARYILHHGRPRATEPAFAPFGYFDKGTMATIGRNAAVVQIRKLELTGFLGWVAWLVIHVYYLIGYRNRGTVLWNWFWNYLFYDRPVRIITGPKQGRPAVLVEPEA